jgi:recombination protein RecA
MAKEPKDNTAQDAGKKAALGAALESIEKQFGKGAIMKLGEAHAVNVGA